MRRCVFAMAASLLTDAPAFAADLARRAPIPCSGAPVEVTDGIGLSLGGLNDRFAPVPPASRPH